MPELATLLPSRRAELVSWPVGFKGQYLIRNRRTGETFQFGEEEHFLLGQLDGRRPGDDICRAFAQRFGQPLSDEDLDEFVHLASERGLLQPPVVARSPDRATEVDRRSPVLVETFGHREWHGQETVPQRSVGPLELAQGAPGMRPLWKRAGSRALKLVSTSVQWPARILSAAAARLDRLRLKHLDFVPRPDDVFVVTYPRSGTTWMQMILYQLTTDGRMDFPHIAEYCPWFERSVRSALGFETRPSPRVFKSHLSYRKIPKGPCKYIYVARAGKDVAVSNYHLYRTYNGYEGTFAEFFDRFLRGKVEFGSWFQHVRGWWEHRHDPNVLFLTYEELTRDLEGSVRKIIAFCGLDVPAKRLPVILERCGFAFMKQHENQFDPALEILWEQGIRLNSFLRNGRVGEGAVHLSSEQANRFDEAFRQQLGRTGFQDCQSRDR